MKANEPPDKKQLDIIASKLTEIAKSNSRLVLNYEETFAKIATSGSSGVVAAAIKELDNINRLKDSIARVVESPWAEFAKQANMSISKMTLTPAFESIMSGQRTIAERWYKDCLSIKDAASKFLSEPAILAVQSQFARISEISVLAEKAALKITGENMGSLIFASIAGKEALKNTSLALSANYRSLLDSLTQTRLSFLTLPPEASTLPPIEFYGNNRFLEAVSLPTNQWEPEISLDRELSREMAGDLNKVNLVNPNLRKLWEGAKLAKVSANPDRVRHFCVSLRELLTQVIHSLAPDEAIRGWSSSPEHYYQDKPTRRARLLYICRGVNTVPFDAFIESDIESLLACMKCLEEGTHAPSASFSPVQLDALLFRTEAAVRLLIRLWQINKTKMTS